MTVNDQVCQDDRFMTVSDKLGKGNWFPTVSDMVYTKVTGSGSLMKFTKVTGL